MGVTGLLRLLQPYSEPKAASNYAGRTLGVDGYAWLHRAAASCAEDLSRGLPSPRLVQSIDNRVRVYEQHGVSLYFVFDGSSLAMKQRVEEQRRRSRDAARAAHTSSSSFSHSKALRSIDITASHAAMVIAYLKTRGIKYVVAPFEADAQLVYLEQQGLVDAILSEDSDLLVFGAKTLLTKSDSKTGSCIEICSDRIPHPLNDLRCLRALAIISGCDYSPGVPGLGPVKTRPLLKKYAGSLDLIVADLVANSRVEPDFLELARKADLAFQFQRVWNPSKCSLTTLNEPSDHEAQQLTDHIIGAQLSRAVAHRIAVGVLDPADQSTELVVHPMIAQFVNTKRPVKLPRPSIYATPLGVSKSINRRLTPVSASVTRDGSTASISHFFKSAPAARGLSRGTQCTTTTSPSPRKAGTAGGLKIVDTDPDKENRGALLSPRSSLGPKDAMDSPAALRYTTPLKSEVTAVYDPAPPLPAIQTPEASIVANKRAGAESSWRSPFRSDTMEDSPLRARAPASTHDTTTSAAKLDLTWPRLRQGSDDSAVIKVNTHSRGASASTASSALCETDSTAEGLRSQRLLSKLATIRQFAYKPEPAQSL